MKLSAWAKKNGVRYHTAYAWFKAGILPAKTVQLPTGTILVDDTPDKVVGNTVTYSRVSSHPQREDLVRQVERCKTFCATSGWPVTRNYHEVGSGMNDNRRQLVRMLESSPTRIVVEHKDRLTRFGFNYLELLLRQQDCEIVVIDRDTEEKSDLMKDLLSVIYSFSARLYGLRKGRDKAKAIKGQLL